MHQVGEAHGYNSAKVGFTRSEKKIMPGMKGGVGVQSWKERGTGFVQGSYNLLHHQVVRGAQSWRKQKKV